MKEYLLSVGFWFYKDCGCRVPGQIYKNAAGLEVKIIPRRQEWELKRDGNKIDQGIFSNPEKINKYL